MHKLVIIGAGGHGKVIADIAIKTAYKNISFVDDNAFGSCLGFPIIGTCADIVDDGETDFVLAVGNNGTRKLIAEKYDLPYVTLIHPSAQIGVGVRMDFGTVVMAGAVINPGTVIGRHCIINSCSVVEHDNKLGDFVHISPNAALGGTVSVGNLTHIGIGATVRNNIDICERCMIGAGAVVVNNIVESSAYIGTPARKKNDRK